MQNIEQQNKFAHQCAWLKRLEVLNKVSFVLAAIINGLPTLIFEDFVTNIVYGFPNTLLLAFWVYYLYMSVDIPFIFFYIICKYLCFKTRVLNQRIKKLEGTRTLKIRLILRAFDSIYRELKKYNSTYLSKYLLIIWFFLGSGVVFLIYIACFEPIRIEMRIVCVYGSTTVSLLYLFIILTASSVAHETKKTYKILNSFYLILSREGRDIIAKSPNLISCYKVN